MTTYAPKAQGHCWIIPGTDLPPIADQGYATLLAEALNAAVEQGRDDANSEREEADDMRRANPLERDYRGLGR